MTRTYAILEVPRSVYDEIRRLLEDARWGKPLPNGDIDMHGLALRARRCPYTGLEECCWSDNLTLDEACQNCGHAERCHR